MTALSSPRTTAQREVHSRQFPVATNAKIYQGALVAVIVASGYATKGQVATTLHGVGVAQETVDNTGGADGALTVKVENGVWLMANSTSTDAITQGDIGANCYIVDDATVAKTNGSSTRSVAGIVADVDSSGVWVSFS